MLIPWITLFLAGAFEIVWATGLKYSDGFSRFWPSVITVLAMVISFSLLSSAMRHIPLGTAYSIWTGIGAIGSVILGIFLFNESASALRLACIALILIGIVGLKITSSAPYY